MKKLLKDILTFTLLIAFGTTLFFLAVRSDEFWSDFFIYTLVIISIIAFIAGRYYKTKKHSNKRKKD